jgi:hypothetical protein
MPGPGDFVVGVIILKIKRFPPAVPELEVDIFRQGSLEMFQQLGIKTQLDDMFGRCFSGQFCVGDLIGMPAQAGRVVHFFQEIDVVDPVTPFHFF